MAKSKLNPYFNFKDYPQEQQFYADFFDEIIRMVGADCLYIPRSMYSVDDILQEPYQVLFDRYYSIPVIQTNPSEPYTNNAPIPTFFGMRWDTTSSWYMSIRMFKELGIEESFRLRPLEGDLILIGPDRNSWRDPKYTFTMFEINYVGSDEPWWPLGKPYLFALSVQDFTYSQEKMATGKEEIDSVATQFSNEAEIDVAVNKQYTEKAKTLIDFTESNPFGNI